MARETMNVVIVGHVDHGKSTLVGRLLADTGTLGEGKLEHIQAVCKSQGKVFEYAFLLDALEEEQGQGITIDSARVFFRTDKRDYIIIDAPGHIEFLKNMVSGAARAEAGVLLIDAKEGVRENSRRHGYLLSMLGIRQIVVAVNKIDLVDYSRQVFEDIVREYRKFLAEVDIEPSHFIPVSAREGDFVAARTPALSWYDGPTILEAMDGFEKRMPSAELALRMPVQDVYKFNTRGDDRRIVVGRVEAGTLRAGDKVMFSPSYKTSTVEGIQVFNAPVPEGVEAGRSAGITLTEEIYVSRGEIMSRLDLAPEVSTKLRANLFWLGRKPMVPGKRYKLKLATAETEVTIDEIHRILDASDLSSSIEKHSVERHDVADLVLRTRHQIAFDTVSNIEATGRFVIVDEYDIAGGGIIREAVVDDLAERRLESRIRDLAWVRGDITNEQRAQLNRHPASMVMVTGAADTGKHAVARALEVALVRSEHRAYLLDGKNVVLGVDADIAFDDIDELVRRFGEVTHILLDAGHLVVSTTNVIGLADHLAIQTQISPFKMFIVHLGPEPEGLPEGADLRLDPHPDVGEAVAAITNALGKRGRLIPGSL
ncbi:GTP-binding protein [Haliangium sp.]|uniref:GTP-binding protein n=1 Tax=Haliangium sp. TaxID=2663208 RepID=UPI003D13A02F